MLLWQRGSESQESIWHYWKVSVWRSVRMQKYIYCSLVLKRQCKEKLWAKGGFYFISTGHITFISWVFKLLEISEITLEWSLMEFEMFLRDRKMLAWTPVKNPCFKSVQQQLWSNVNVTHCRSLLRWVIKAINVWHLMLIRATTSLADLAVTDQSLHQNVVQNDS